MNNIETEHDSSVKYLLDGSAVHVIEQSETRAIVQKLYDYGEEVMESEPIVVPRIFDSPPTERLSEEIARLEGRISELQSKRTELDQQQREMESKAKERAAKFKQFKALDRLEDFIDGKITHYVEDSYRGPCVIELKDAVVNDDYDRPRPLRLLSLFGATKGQLDWKLSHYSDGSGCQTECWPFTSREDAVAKVEELLREKMLKGPREDYVQIADKYGITIPQDYRDAAKEKARENLRNQITAKEKEMQVLRAQLETT